MESWLSLLLFGLSGLVLALCRVQQVDGEKQQVTNEMQHVLHQWNNCKAGSSCLNICVAWRSHNPSDVWMIWRNARQPHSREMERNSEKRRASHCERFSWLCLINRLKPVVEMAFATQRGGGTVCLVSVARSLALLLSLNCACLLARGLVNYFPQTWQVLRGMAFLFAWEPEAGASHSFQW